MGLALLGQSLLPDEPRVHIPLEPVPDEKICFRPFTHIRDKVRSGFLPWEEFSADAYRRGNRAVNVGARPIPPRAPPVKSYSPPWQHTQSEILRRTS
jgi:hypothetical protein